MDFQTFARRAEEILAGIPPEFLRGITGVEAHRSAPSHPHLPEVYTLGECANDAVSALTEPEALRSRVHLYHGAFARVARRDPDFDWEAELRETILHEIRHHIEDRAGILDLRHEDDEDDALHRFYHGEEMPDGWYRAGEELEPDLFRIGDDLFLELRLRDADLESILGREIELFVLDEPFMAEIPDDLSPGEILTFTGEGLERPGGGFGDLHLVVPGTIAR